MHLYTDWWQSGRRMIVVNSALALTARGLSSILAQSEIFWVQTHCICITARGDVNTVYLPYNQDVI